MEGFDRDYTKSKTLVKSQSQLDNYERLIKRTANRTIRMESMTLGEQASATATMNYLNRSYTIILVSMASAAISYPISVRIVKRIFRLKSFFNIHFAILPIMANWNAIVWGLAQGYINGTMFNKNYPISSTSIKGDVWNNSL